MDMEFWIFIIIFFIILFIRITIIVQLLTKAEIKVQFGNTTLRNNKFATYINLTRNRTLCFRKHSTALQYF